MPGKISDLAFIRGKRTNRGAIPDAENGLAAPQTGERQASDTHTHFAGKSRRANAKF